MAHILAKSFLTLGLLFNIQSTPETYIRPQTLDEKIEILALEYKQDPDIARAIIKCESMNDSEAIGTLAVVGKDYGYFQINSYFHEEEARRLGFDIYSPDDNLEYGFYLMEKEGLRPWKSSQGCWEKSLNIVQ